MKPLSRSSTSRDATKSCDSVQTSCQDQPATSHNVQGRQLVRLSPSSSSPPTADRTPALLHSRRDLPLHPRLSSLLDRAEPFLSARCAGTGRSATSGPSLAPRISPRSFADWGRTDTIRNRTGGD